MPTTPKLGLRYPNATDAPDGPGAFLNLATDLDNLQQDALLSFPGSITNYSSRSSNVRRIPGNIIVLQLAVTLSSGFSATLTSTIAQAPAGFFPAPSGGGVPFVAATAGGSGWGGYAICEVGTDGVIHLNYLSGSATGILGSVTYRL